MAPNIRANGGVIVALDVLRFVFGAEAFELRIVAGDSPHPPPRRRG